jgi:hypothetical protein
MRPRLRARQAVNLANGSTLAGLGVAAVGGATIGRSVDGLFTGTGYRLPVPPAPAFCLGNVIVTRGDVIVLGSRLFRHEARHATQFAWCGGVVMIPLYLAAAGASWALTGDFGACNVFERLAGLADGGYADKPLRPAIRRAASRLAASGSAAGRSAAGLLAVGRRIGDRRIGDRRIGDRRIGDRRIGGGRVSGPGRRAGARALPDPGQDSGARDGSSASPSR